MNAQEPRIEDWATWGDVVGAIIAGAICIGAVALAVTFVAMRDVTEADQLDAKALAPGAERCDVIFRMRAVIPSTPVEMRWNRGPIAQI